MHALIALGANIGDPAAQLRAAVERISRILVVDSVSSVYRTEPVGLTQQPDFLNLVVSGRTDVTIFRLHAFCQAVEREFGRERTVRDAPRTIDLDILAFGPLVYRSDVLTVPHPRMHERAFVLTPLVEIEPEWRHPRYGATASELHARLGAGTGVERWSDPPSA